MGANFASDLANGIGGLTTEQAVSVQGLHLEAFIHNNDF